MTELEKANETIKELLQINEELGGINGQHEKARRKIIELENKLKKAEELNNKYQRKLINRKALIKESIREVMLELIEPLREE